MNFNDVMEKAREMRAAASERANELRKDVVRLDEVDLSGKRIGSVDGGLLKKSYHPFDVVITRALGVVYTYGEKFSVSYYPSKFPKRDIEFYIGDEFKFFSNITRVKKEIKTSLELVDKFDLDALIVDGSIVPHPSLRPKESSVLYENYEEIIGYYKQLYGKCKSKGCLLAGVVKDSKSSHYFKEFRDTFVLSFALKGGERTKSFKYNETNLSDAPQKDEIFSMYIRPNGKSRPIRIDFLGQENELRTANLVYTLSKFSSVGIPNIILECDKRVKLSDADISMLEKKMMSVLPNVRLRRNGHLF